MSIHFFVFGKTYDKGLKIIFVVAKSQFLIFSEKIEAKETVFAIAV
jgi:hypothetical protein